MQDKKITLPISKLSYSSFTQLLRNPMIFKVKEILGVYDSKSSVSAVIGKAVHEALKFYYGGDKERPVPANDAEAKAEARQTGLDYITKLNEQYIDYGKTGSMEKILAGYTQALDFYFAEEPTYNEILICEEKLEAELETYDGQKLPLPAVGIPDLVHRRKDGGIEIIDLKVTTSFTDYETEDYIKIVQAQFLNHLLRSRGIIADRMLFRELKRTENKDGSKQIRDYVIPLDHEPYRIIFYNLYKDVVAFLSQPNPIFLPNLSDPFDGEHAGLLYAQGLINADMSDVEVMHKVRDVAFTSKKFVPSRLDSELNKHLLPEEKVKLRLAEFGIPVEPVETKVGASVTQYRFKVSAGVRMTTIKKHADDIARALETKGDVRILAPIPGTSLVGVEIENAKRTSLKLNDSHMIPGTLSLPIGVDVAGEIHKVSLDEMPHLLIAGTTGSGKSVLLHTLIKALTKQLSEDDMKLVLIDPKRVELVAFNKKPHLLEKVIYEYDGAIRALLRLVDEMERRYKLLEQAGKRDIKEYNESKRKADLRLPYIVAIIDEFADFMGKSKHEEEKRSGKAYSGRSKAWLYKKASSLGHGKLIDIHRISKAELIDILEEHDAEDELNRADADIEELIVRLAQMARAVGIHLIIATQRPSVDVITGLIKANFPTRIALTTASPTDSIVILGVPGAEKLSGKGDLILMHPGNRGNVRLQSLTN